MLTKSDVANVRICERRAFLYRKNPELAAASNKADQARFAQGREIGKLARREFSGYLISTPSTDLDNAVHETLSALTSGETTLFEAAFVIDDLVARPDILRRSGENQWEIIEVKSTLSVKPEHILDAAFQAHVLTASRLSVNKVSLMHLNPEYLGNADTSSLFIIQDISQQVFDVIVNLPHDLITLRNILDETLPPEVIPNTHCKATSCPFIDRCFSELPRFDVTTLPRVSHSKVAVWHSEGLRDLRDIPSTELTPRQRLIQSVVQTDTPHIDDDLSKEIKQYRYPIAFVDFEAEGSAIPLFPGVRPYSAIPFQWSMHILDAQDSVLEHKKFLHTQSSDPRQQFASTLLFALQGINTIVTYSAYEKTRIKALVSAEIPGAEELDTLFSNSLDLMRTVEKYVYFSDFLGQSSVKTVYPALVPGAGYSDLVIQDGSTAATEFRRMLSPATAHEEAASIAINLEKYCERDTLAMVQIYHRLVELSKHRTSV